MPKTALTDLQIKHLSLPAKGTCTYWDTVTKGLGVRVSQGGTKTFIVLVGSGQRRKLGHYPAVTLKDARKQAMRTLGEVALGRYIPKSIAFEDALKQFLEDRERRIRAATVKEYRRSLNKHFPFGRRAISEITTQDIAKRLDRLKETPSEARHALTNIKVLFRWALRRGYLLNDPSSALQVSTRAVSRERVLTDQELAEVLTKAALAPFPYGKIVTLLALTGQRRGEIAGLRWDYIDADSRTITLPATATKNHRRHVFPYGQRVAEVLETVPVQGDHLFPAAREHVRGKPTTVVNGWHKPKVDFDRTLDNVDHWTLHDLRRTFSSSLAALGVQQVVVEKLLNHVSGGTISPIAAVYNRHTYMDEMRAAIAVWDDKIASLRKA